MTVSLVCPICRRIGGDGVRRAWPLRRKRKTLACSNPACDGRFVTEPFPILHRNPGAAFERMVHVPTGLPLEALGMMLRSLPEGSALRRSFEHQSRDLWRHYHDLMPEGYRPGFVHPAPFPLRALSILDTVQLPAGVRALIVGSGPGRAALELAQRLNKLAESQTLPEGGDATLAHFYPELFALDLDPMQLIAMRLLGKQPLEVLLRGSSEGWHSPERLELPAALRKNADLIQPICGDALDPPFEGESFDLIVCLNLLERVSAPLRLLSELQRLLRPGGHLLLSSAFSWRAEVTPPAARLAAVVPHARRPDVELLQEILAGRLTTGEHFDLYSVAVMQPTPAFTRHYDTELSAEIAHVSLWKRPAKGSVLSTGAYRAVRDEPSK